MRSLRFFLLTIFFLLSQSVYAQNSNNNSTEKPNTTVKARVYRAQNKSKITGLSVLSLELPLFFVPKEKELKSYVDLPLSFVRPGWVLKAKDKILIDQNSQAQIYSIPIYLKPELNALTLTAEGPQGEKETEVIYISTPEVSEKVKDKNHWDKILISMGISNLDYSQSGTGSYKSLNGLFDLQYASAPQHWSGFGYYSSLSLSSLTFWDTPVKSGIQMIQGKADLSYFLKNEKSEPWRHQFLVGGHYLTMLSNNSPFGFTNLLSPDFGYRGHYLLDDDSGLIFDFRYAGLALPTQFKTYGMTFNTSYYFKFSNNHRGEIGSEIFLYKFSPEENFDVQFSSLRFKFGYSL